MYIDEQSILWYPDTSLTQSLKGRSKPESQGPRCYRKALIQYFQL